LFFVDSDMRLGVGVIEACLAAVSAGGRAIIVPEVVIGSSFWARCRNLEKRLGDCQAGYEGARFMIRADFLRVGGYDERLIVGEDFDLHMSLVEGGVAVSRVETPIEHLEEGTRLRDYVHKWRYYASHADPFVAKRGTMRRHVPTLFEVAIRQWRVAARDPITFCGLFALKLLEFSIIGWRLRFSRVSSTQRD
jgi:arabinofuranan 3-O-arabinosyltransferase